MSEVVEPGPETEAAEDPLDKIIREAVDGEEAQAPEAVAEVPAEPAPEADIELPKHWAEEEKARWNAVNPADRALLLEARKSVEAAADKKFQKAAAYERHAKHWKEIKQIFAPLQDHLKMNGATKLQAIKQLAHAQMALMNRPDQALAWLAQQYAGNLPNEAKAATLQNLQRALGIQGTAQKQPNPTDDYLDPRAAQEIAALKHQTQQLLGYVQNQSATAQQQAVASAERVIQDFKTAKDASGAPLHPYYAEVENEVTRLITTAKTKPQESLIDPSLPPAEMLKAAYEKAIRLNDTVWDKIDLERKQAKAKADAEKRRAEVAQAKPASRNVVGQSVSAPAKGKKLSLDDAMKEALAEARA